MASMAEDLMLELSVTVASGVPGRPVGKVWVGESKNRGKVYIYIWEKECRGKVCVEVFVGMVYMGGVCGEVYMYVWSDAV